MFRWCLSQKGMVFYMEFKNRIKHLRNKKGITTTQLAAHIEKGEAAIRMWEIGRSKPDCDTLIKLAKYFNCKTDYLLGLAEPETEDDKTVSNGIDRLTRNIEKLYHKDSESLLENLNQCLESLNDSTEDAPYSSYILNNWINILSLFNNMLNSAVKLCNMPISNQLKDFDIAEFVRFSNSRILLNNACNEVYKNNGIHKRRFKTIGS